MYVNLKNNPLYHCVLVYSATKNIQYNKNVHTLHCKLLLVRDPSSKKSARSSDKGTKKIVVRIYNKIYVRLLDNIPVFHGPLSSYPQPLGYKQVLTHYPECCEMLFVLVLS